MKIYYVERSTDLRKQQPTYASSDAILSTGGGIRRLWPTRNTHILQEVVESEFHSHRWGRVGERADSHRVHAAAPAGNRRKDRRRPIAYADVGVDVAYMRVVENGAVPVNPRQAKNWGQMVVRWENYLVEARRPTWRCVVIFIALMDYGIYLWQRLSGKSPNAFTGSISFFSFVNLPGCH
ncbi:uncharacterized protein LOC103969858 isoform X1 [Musa acuminata AAA Group]|uniref:uncharacterized protein LOC103969858 isoform X1 n=1 Tax=Musa acuminata AAA Group TaxID=214697 RepID=UPI0031D7C64F